MITTGAIYISQALMVTQTLLELNIGYNKIGDDGIIAIAGSLSNSSITALDISSSGIGFVGVQSLAATLSTNLKMREIRLWDNPVTTDGARLLMKSAIGSGICEYVSINDEYWNDKEIKEMKNILNRRQTVRNYAYVMYLLLLW